VAVTLSLTCGTVDCSIAAGVPRRLFHQSPDAQDLGERPRETRPAESCNPQPSQGHQQRMLVRQFCCRFHITRALPSCVKCHDPAAPASACLQSVAVLGKSFSATGKLESEEERLCGHTSPLLTTSLWVTNEQRRKVDIACAFDANLRGAIIYLVLFLCMNHERRCQIS